jgi:hypothetical protein
MEAALEPSVPHWGCSTSLSGLELPVHRTFEVKWLGLLSAQSLLPDQSMVHEWLDLLNLSLHVLELHLALILAEALLRLQVCLSQVVVRLLLTHRGRKGQEYEPRPPIQNVKEKSCGELSFSKAQDVIIEHQKAF